MSSHQSFLDSIDKYYSEKVTLHGNTPAGVDWNGVDSQLLRFKILTKIITLDEFSINDIGCGYGALLDYMISHYHSFEYRGNDISRDMISVANSLHQFSESAKFEHSMVPSRPANYCLASGIFNVKLNASDRDWEEYTLRTLDIMHESSTHGFAFNCLTSYSDPEKMVHTLHYFDPLQLFDYCKKRFSRNIALLHDYNLYEFTIIVDKHHD